MSVDSKPPSVLTRFVPITLPKIIALILLVAAAFKFYDLASHSPVSSVFIASKADWEFSLCAAEAVLGIWLLFGLFPHITWLLLIPLFMVYLGVSLFHALSGQSSCGCFGAQIEVNPWVISTLDAILLIALLWWAPTTPNALPASNKTILRLSGFIVAALVALVMAVFAFSHFAPSVLREEQDDPTFSQERVLLQPRSWVGKRFPLLKHTDLGPELAQGTWIVILHKWNCGICKEIIPHYVELAQHKSTAPQRFRVAFLEIPSKDEPAAPESSPQYRHRPFTLGQLSATKQWIVHTPQILRLKDGVVEVATDQPNLLLRHPMIPADGKGNIVIFNGDKEERILMPDFRRVRHEEYLKEVACGPLALLTILNKLGIRLSSEQTEALLAEAKDYGIDMLRLKRLAEQHGLHTLGVAISPKKLREIGHLAIVHLEGVGFAAVIGHDADGFRVVYPLQAPGLVPEELFKRSFGTTGYALLLASTPLSAEKLGLRMPKEEQPNGPCLRLSQSVLTAGRIYHRKWESSLQLTNTGTEPLRIEEVKTSHEASVFVAKVDQPVLAPGQTTTLRAKGQFPVLGGFTFYIELTTNQKEFPRIKIPVRGYVDQPVGFEVPNILACDLGPGEVRKWEVPLDLPSNLTLDQLRIRAPEKSPLKVVLRLNGAGKPILALDWTGGTVGWHRYFLEVYQEPLADATRSPFHFAVEVKSHLKFFPLSTCIDDNELKSTWKRLFTCQTLEKMNRLGELTWSDIRWNRLLQVDVKQNGQNTWVISVEPKGEIDAKELQGTAILWINAGSKGRYSLTFYLGELALRSKSSE